MENIKYDSFELLYLYIENIRCFESQEFVFTTEYNIKYDKDTRELNIEERHDKDYLKGFFGPNISNINVIVGKNGSGKSTILELLGDTENIGLDNLFYSNDKGWFAIYKTNKPHDFLIEGFQIKLINNKTNNLYTPNNDFYNIIFDSNENKFKKLNYPYENLNMFYFKRKISNGLTSPEDINSKHTTLNYNLLLNKQFIKTSNYQELYALISQDDFFKNFLNSPNLSFEMHIYEPFKNTKLDEITLKKLLEQLNKLSSKEKFEVKIKFLICTQLRITNSQALNLLSEELKNNDLVKSVNSVLKFLISNSSKDYLGRDHYKNINDSINKFIKNTLELKNDSNRTIYSGNINIFTSKIYINFNYPNEKCYNFLESYVELKTIIESTTKNEFNISHISFGNNISEGELKLITIFAGIYNALINSTEKNV